MRVDIEIVKQKQSCVISLAQFMNVDVHAMKFRHQRICHHTHQSILSHLSIFGNSLDQELTALKGGVKLGIALPHIRQSFIRLCHS